MEISFEKAASFKKHPEDSALGFGTYFTDYMFNMDYNPDQGWHNPRIEPYGPMEMDPSTMVLHYGQAIFEGLKAYRTESGDIQLFRPKDNFKRFNQSAHRLCIPELDVEFALEACWFTLAVTSGTRSIHFCAGSTNCMPRNVKGPPIAINSSAVERGRGM